MMVFFFFLENETKWVFLFLSTFKITITIHHRLLFLQTAGVVLIYFLVLVQFQMEGYKQILGSNSSDAVVAVVCHSWPCLERDD